MDHNLINIQQNGVLNESEPLINQEIKMANKQKSGNVLSKPNSETSLNKVSSGITNFKQDFINFFKQNGLSDYWDYLLLFKNFIQSLLLLNGDVLGDYILATTYLE